MLEASAAQLKLSNFHTTKLAGVVVVAGIVTGENADGSELTIHFCRSARLELLHRF